MIHWQVELQSDMFGPPLVAGGVLLHAVFGIPQLSYAHCTKPVQSVDCMHDWHADVEKY